MSWERGVKEGSWHHAARSQTALALHRQSRQPQLRLTATSRGFRRSPAGAAAGLQREAQSALILTYLTLETQICVA